MNLKILMLAPGSSIHTQRPLRLLLDHDCEVIFADRVNPHPEGKTGYSYIWYPFFGRCFYRRLGHPIGDWLGSLFFVQRLKWINSRYQPDLVHVHWVDCHAYYCFSAGIKPLVLSVWGSDINNCQQPGADVIHTRYVARALSNADMVIAPNQDMADKCNDLVGTAVKTKIIHWGVNTDLFTPGLHASARIWRQKLRIPDDAQVLLSIRAIAPIYRQEIILEAFADARKRLKKQAYLVFIIYNLNRSEYLENLRKQAEELGISEYIRWIEGVPHNEVPMLFNLADAVINFPAMDGFPVTLLEAAACECQVITNLLPGYKNSLIERYFRLVRSGEKEELSKAIISELNQEFAFAQQLSHAREEVTANYSESAYITRLMAVYDTLLSSSRPGE